MKFRIFESHKTVCNRKVHVPIVEAGIVRILESLETTKPSVIGRYVSALQRQELYEV